MKCLSCGTPGKHFYQKICSECVSQGISRGDITLKRYSELFIGKECTRDAREHVQDLRETGANISSVRIKYTEHETDPRKDRAKLTFTQYTGGNNGKKGTTKANKS